MHDTDIVIRSLKLVIEYDSHYFHKEQAVADRAKTEAIQKAGWNVIRIREKPLGLLQPTDIAARKGQYKETCDLILQRLQNDANLILLTDSSNVPRQERAPQQSGVRTLYPPGVGRQKGQASARSGRDRSSSAGAAGRPDAILKLPDSHTKNAPREA